MATPATSIAGYGGSVTGLTGVTEVKNWKIDLKIAKLDATCMAGTTGTGSVGWEEYIAGLQGASGSFTSGGTVAPSRGADAAASFITKTSGGIEISGSIFIERATVNDPVDGAVSYDCEFAFSGSVSVAAA
jgi:hypothetical protein